MEFDRTEVQVPAGSEDFLLSKADINIKRSPDVWFEDGTIILEAERTQFKVFKGMLAANSTVFSDMFVVGSYPDGSDMAEGCPVVHLYDSPLDLMHFLKAIHYVG